MQMLQPQVRTSANPVPYQINVLFISGPVGKTDRLYYDILVATMSISLFGSQSVK